MIVTNAPFEAFRLVIAELEQLVGRLRERDAQWCRKWQNTVDMLFKAQQERDALRDRFRRALDTLDLARGSLGIDQSVAVEAIDRCLEENKELFCEGMLPSGGPR